MSYNLGEETGLINISHSQLDLKCQGTMIPGTPIGGGGGGKSSFVSILAASF